MIRAAIAVVAILAAAPAAAHALTVTVERPPPAQPAQPVTFTVTAEGEGPLTYAWSFGDGTTTPPSPEPTAVHTYRNPGHYPVIVTVRDAVARRTGTFLQTVHRAVTPGPPTASSTIVSDAAGARVFHVNPDQGTVTCIDTAALVRAWEVEVGPAPRTLALAPDGTLWVAVQDSSSIAIVDPDRGRRIASIRLPYASRPYGLAFRPDGGAAYVTLQATGEVAVVDPGERAVVQRIAVGPKPTGIAVAHDGARILVTRFVSPADRGEVTEIDGASLEVAAVHALAVDVTTRDGEDRSRGVPNYLASITIAPDGHRAWIPAKKDNVLRGGARDGLALTFETTTRALLSQLDLDQGGEVAAARIDLNNRSLPMAVAFSPLGDYAFVAVLGTSHVEVVDAYTGKTVAGAPDAGKAPLGLVLLPDGRLFVHAFLSRTVEVYDASGVLSADDFALPRIGAVASVERERLAPDVLEGKRIFYDAADPRMARDGYLSCATCHLDGFEDGQVWDFTNRGEGLRNTISLLGRRGTGHGPVHWSANFDEIQDFEHDVRNAFGGKGFMADADFHHGTRDTTLGDAKAGVSPPLDALAAYVASLDRVHPSPFREPGGAMTADAEAGAAIFARLACDRCHAGAACTDSAPEVRHDVGTIRPTSGHRLGGELTGLDTPTLLGVWETAPYLHDGSAPTLRDVLTTANPDDRHGATSALSETELDQLVAYLLELDSGPPPDPEPIDPEPVDPVPDPHDARSPDENRPPTAGGCDAAGDAATPGALALVALAALIGRARRRRFQRPARC